MIKPNPEIDVILNDATSLAKKNSHEYVTVEHVALSMVKFTPFKKMLTEYGIDVKGLTKDLAAYVASIPCAASTGKALTPRKTTGVERVFNRALTQILFSGRDTMQVSDLYQSIAVEHTSYASYYFLKYGIDRDEFGEFCLKNYEYGEGKEFANMSQADKILDEFCTNLNESARNGKIDPIIGRNTEIAEITEVLAKRNKNNVLLVGDPGVGKCLTYDNLIRVRVTNEIYQIIKTLEKQHND